MRAKISVIAFFFLASCGKPSGISDHDYEEYQKLGAPKLLYSCNKGRQAKPKIDLAGECYTLPDPSDQNKCLKERMENINAKKAMVEKLEDVIEVNYIAGIGLAATYNKILSDAEKSCIGVFKILESKQ